MRDGITAPLPLCSSLACFDSSIVPPVETANGRRRDQGSSPVGSTRRTLQSFHGRQTPSPVRPRHELVSGWRVRLVVFSRRSRVWEDRSIQRALAAEAEKAPVVTAETIQQAEWIAGLKLSEEDRKSLATGMNQAMREFTTLRAIQLHSAPSRAGSQE